MAPSFKRVHVIVNPAAGRDKPILNVLNRVFYNKIDWDISITRRSGDAFNFAQAAVKDGADIVAALGGDGTVMEVASALMGTDIPLAIFPGGTANVMSIELGIPWLLADAAKLILSENVKVWSIDVGLVGEEKFLLRLGIGFEAKMVNNADRATKDRFGQLAYTLSSIQTARTDFTNATYRITVDGETHEATGFSCMVANSVNIGLLGVGFAANARVDDGLLDVLLLRQSANQTPGQPVSPDPSIMHWQGREIAVESDPPQPVISDGESIGDTPVSARVLPGMLKVLVPKTPVHVGIGELALDQITMPSRSLDSFLRLVVTRPMGAISEIIDQISRMLFGAPLDRFSRVLPNLLVGSQHTRAGLERLVARGVTAILNVRAESDDQVLGCATDRHLHLSVIDQMPPSLEHLQRGVDFITEELANNGVVYVHCNHGLGRGPTFVAAYLVSMGLSTEKAWNHIRHVRPFIRPTQQQVDQVARFERHRLGD